MPSSSPEALYHAIPQAPVAVNPVLSEADPDNEDAVEPVLLNSGTRQVQFILGCAVLLPWNAMITATPYFISRLANSPLRPAFSSYLSTSFTAANFIALAHATITSKQSSPSARIVRSLLCLAILTFALTISTLVTIQPSVFFAFCLLIGIAQAVLGSYLQTAVIAITSVFGPAAVQISMSGQAAVAVVVSGVQVSSAVISTWGATPVSTTIEQAPEERSAFIFFALSTVFLLVAAFAQRWLTKQPSYRTAVKHLETKEIGDHEESRGLVLTAHTKFPTFDKAHVLRVAKANWLYEVACAYVFIVTLSVFPPITTSIRPTNPRTHPLLFSAIHFLVFACGDLYGRYLCSIPRFMVWSAKRLVTLSLMRTCFVPLFLMCNVQRPSSSTIPVSPIINSDWLFMLILFLFAASNGYVSSMCMMSAPSLDHNPRLRGRRDDVDIAATVAGFCLVGGLALGSMASFVVRGLVCSCNPFIE